MGLQDYRYALEFKETMTRLVREEVERQRPRYQMATVVSIDRANRRCVVNFPGDTTNATVSMGALQPSAPAQVVRVEGLSGDRYIADVMGPAYQEASHSDGIILGTTGISGPAWDQEKYFQRAQTRITGGGVRNVTSTGVSWSQRFISLGLGQQSHLATSGYFDITMPADGTVITGAAGGSSVTVAGGLIPLPGWATLWYILPMGSSSASLPANFRITGYNVQATIPPDWIMVATRNSETGQVNWCDGRNQDYWRVPSLLNGWVNYLAGTHQSAQYKKENGWVHIRGLVKSGTIHPTATTGRIFLLPVGFRPIDEQLIFYMISNQVDGRVDIFTDGSVQASIGSSGWMNMTGIYFQAEA